MIIPVEETLKIRNHSALIAARQPHYRDPARTCPQKPLQKINLPHGGLTGLLDYVEALVKLDERVATRLSQHKLADGSQFALHQHEIAGLPAIQCDTSDADGPIWLRVQRLQRTTPPVFDGGRQGVDRHL